LWAGTGKAARQQNIVQGRITDGTLFPLISARIQAAVEGLVKKTFRDLHNVADVVLALIVNDVEMALASGAQAEGEHGLLDSPEIHKLREELIAEIKDMKGQHEDLVTTISRI
jgi:hypothetical protein